MDEQARRWRLDEFKCTDRPEDFREFAKVCARLGWGERGFNGVRVRDGCGFGLLAFGVPCVSKWDR